MTRETGGTNWLSCLASPGLKTSLMTGLYERKIGASDPAPRSVAWAQTNEACPERPCEKRLVTLV